MNLKTRKGISDVLTVVKLSHYQNFIKTGWVSLALAVTVNYVKENILENDIRKIEKKGKGLDR